MWKRYQWISKKYNLHRLWTQTNKIRIRIHLTMIFWEKFKLGTLPEGQLEKAEDSKRAKGNFQRAASAGWRVLQLSHPYFIHSYCIRRSNERENDRDIYERKSRTKVFCVILSWHILVCPSSRFLDNTALRWVGTRRWIWKGHKKDTKNA